MFADMMFLSFISQMKCSSIFILELMLIGAYTVVLILLEVHEIGKNSQVIEFYLLMFRVFFLAFRAILMVVHLFRKRKVRTSEIELGNLEDCSRVQMEA